MARAWIHISTGKYMHEYTLRLCYSMQNKLVNKSLHTHVPAYIYDVRVCKAHAHHTHKITCTTPNTWLDTFSSDQSVILFTHKPNVCVITRIRSSPARFSCLPPLPYQPLQACNDSSGMNFHAFGSWTFACAHDAVPPTQRMELAGSGASPPGMYSCVGMCVPW